MSEKPEIYFIIDGEKINREDVTLAERERAVIAREKMRIEKYEKTISVGDYLRDYVNVAEFLDKCRQCENYDKVWSCPEFDFDPVQHWKKYDTLEVHGLKIYLDVDENDDWQDSLHSAKESLTEELFARENDIPGSVSLSAGNCKLCTDGCARASGDPCVHPDQMRYSIESLGGNVGLTCSKLLGIELQWVTEGQAPEYFVLVGGLLY